jgi:hypothetical protein
MTILILDLVSTLKVSSIAAYLHDLVQDESAVPRLDAAIAHCIMERFGNEVLARN